MPFVSPSIARRIIPVALTSLMTLALSCREPLGPGSTLLAPVSAAHDILDGAHGGGSRHFYFLPPMVSAPQDDGTFDAGVSPEVEICALVQGACVQPFVARYTTMTGPGAQTVRVSDDGQHYIVNWDTGLFSLDQGATYRILVRVSGTAIGYADVTIVNNGSAVKNVGTSSTIALVDGRTLPIKFRVDQGLVTSIVVSPAIATVVAGATQQFVATAYDAHGTAINGGAVAWSSGNTGVATISSSGVALAIAPGSTQIRADVDAATGSATINVTPAIPTVARVSADWLHSCELKTDATVKCWGSNSYGESSVPSGLSRAAQVSAGAWHNCVLTTSATVECWGLDGYGQVTVPTGLGPVAQVSAGWYHTCAVKTDGMVACWGYDYYGEGSVPAGLGTVRQLSGGGYYNCAVMTDATVRCWGDNTTGQSVVPAGLSSVAQVSAGSLHTCALKTDGTVVCWGQNDYGQSNVPSGLSSIAEVSVGRYHTCTRATDGNVACWGYNGGGEATVPAGLAPVTQISAGAFHTCAVKRDGSVACWGENGNGQLAVP